VPERSPGAEGPRHLVKGSVEPSWFRSIHPGRLLVAGVLSFAALPVLVLDNLSSGPSQAEAVETVASSTTATTARPTTTSTTSTTVAPTTTAPPTTAPPTTAPPTTAAPTTAPPTTAPRRVAPPTTAPPTTAPPTTAPPATSPPPPAGSVEATIRSYFGDAGDAAVAVARCESSLNPSARSAAGYRGLFQLSPSHATAFASVTGRDFEDAWDEAGPNSQYAAHLYAQRGWAPWGSCAP
jgi:soluble lytic murein transglycosylase-like protein